MNRTSRGRREALTTLAGLALAPLLETAHAQPALPATPADVEGPFYPVRFPADRDANLVHIAGHAREAKGERLALTGTVRDTAGRPLPGVRIELWQCDATGHYHHVDGDTPGDPDFQGYGETTSDAEGRYAFRTIRPVGYGGRPPHLHFRLTVASSRTLTTQLYVQGDRSAEDARLSADGRSRRDRQRVALAPADGGYAARYDFVLA